MAPHTNEIISFENIDVANVRWSPLSFSLLLDVLHERGAVTKRLKAFKAGVDDDCLRLLACWLDTMPAESLPSEIHLSHNPVTDDGFQALLTTIEAKRAELSAPAPPIWLRVEATRVDLSVGGPVVTPLLDSGRLELVAKVGDRRAGPAAIAMPLWSERSPMPAAAKPAMPAQAKQVMPAQAAPAIIKLTAGSRPLGAPALPVIKLMASGRPAPLTAPSAPALPTVRVVGGKGGSSGAGSSNASDKTGGNDGSDSRGNSWDRSAWNRSSGEWEKKQKDNWWNYNHEGGNWWETGNSSWNDSDWQKTGKCGWKDGDRKKARLLIGGVPLNDALKSRDSQPQGNEGWQNAGKQTGGTAGSNSMTAISRGEARLSDTASRGQASSSPARSRTPPPQREPEGPLPPNWEKHWSDEYHIPYYWNNETGDSLWECPAA